jgi:hypothetical protein
MALVELRLAATTDTFFRHSVLPTLSQQILPNTLPQVFAVLKQLVRLISEQAQR